jgi:branched-chain amino acid transport system permease protein
VITILAQVVVNWIMISLIYCLMALGLTLIYSVMGVLNFAHGAIYMLGGYVTYYSVVGFGLPYPVGLVSAFVLTGLLGILIYKGVIKYFRTNVLVCLIITVGLANIFENGAYIVFSPYEKSVPSITSGAVQGPLGVTLSAERLITMLLALALALALLFLINRSKPGRTLRSVAEDTEAALLQGVNAENAFSLGMFLASGLAGVAGALMAPVFSVGPFIGSDMIMNSFIVIILGGVGSISGALLGSFVLGLVTSFGSTFLSGDVATMISFALLILILIFKPRGLLGGL